MRMFAGVNATPITHKQAIIEAILAKKAIKYKNLPAVGRTHGQHTSIISFGLKKILFVPYYVLM